MLPPIILTAFGTTTAAKTTYQHLETEIQQHFQGSTLLWAYSSRSVARELRDTHTTDIRHPADILKQLAADGCTEAIVQSLHLLPGHEFHQLHHEVRRVETISCQLGMPLLSSPRDYQSILDLLTPLIMHDQQQAVLLVGHGTRHPVWPAYLALENLLQKRFGTRIFMGVVEHYPETTDVEERILAAGYHRVLMIPFFLVAGMHFRRDMMGDDNRSWRNRLIRKGLKVEAIHKGIGMLPGIGDLVARHIHDALAAQQEKRRD